MKMVRHQTEGMNPCPELFSAKSQPIEAEEIIVISEKELLALVAAIDTRVERAGEMEARFASPKKNLYICLKIPFHLSC
jgi:hypothetical protein